MMKRRSFLCAIAALSAAVVRIVPAQAAGRTARIGYLTTATPSANAFLREFHRGLHDLGWVPGQNVEIDYRFGEGNFDRLPSIVAELVRTNPEVIVAISTPAALAVKRATATIPVVMVGVAAPVELGLVASLARPSGNVTGLSWTVGLETVGKSLELFKQVVPNARRVAVLSNAVNPAQTLVVRELKAAAQPLDLQLQLLEVRDLASSTAPLRRSARST